jgi:Glycosyl transferase family 2
MAFSDLLRSKNLVRALIAAVIICYVFKTISFTEDNFSSLTLKNFNFSRIEKKIGNRFEANKSIKRDENNLFDVFVIPLPAEILEYHRRLNLTNPGHLGAPVKFSGPLPSDIQAEIDHSNQEFKFNEFVSRLIPLDRQLRDMRQGTCKTAEYSKELPKASIILAFYNEPFSMVMRTIYSILKRSPPELIEEIILIDDCSDQGEEIDYSEEKKRCKGVSSI